MLVQRNTHIQLPRCKENPQGVDDKRQITATFAGEFLPIQLIYAAKSGQVFLTTFFFANFHRKTQRDLLDFLNKYFFFTWKKPSKAKVTH